MAVTVLRGGNDPFGVRRRPPRVCIATTGANRLQGIAVCPLCERVFRSRSLGYSSARELMRHVRQAHPRVHGALRAGRCPGEGCTANFRGGWAENQPMIGGYQHVADHLDDAQHAGLRQPPARDRRAQAVAEEAPAAVQPDGVWPASIGGARGLAPSPRVEDDALRMAQRALYAAAKSGRMQDLRRAMARGADPNDGGEDGFTPLMTAAEAGHASVVAELMRDPRCDADRKNTYGQTALVFAAQNGRVEVLRVLLALAPPAAACGGGAAPAGAADWVVLGSEAPGDGSAAEAFDFADLNDTRRKQHKSRRRRAKKAARALGQKLGDLFLGAHARADLAAGIDGGTVELAPARAADPELLCSGRTAAELARAAGHHAAADLLADTTRQRQVERMTELLGCDSAFDSVAERARALCRGLGLEAPPHPSESREEEEVDFAALEKGSCIVCFEAPADAALVPCGHAQFCRGCAEQCRVCPVCRTPFTSVLQLFM